MNDKPLDTHTKSHRRESKEGCTLCRYFSLMLRINLNKLTVQPALPRYTPSSACASCPPPYPSASTASFTAMRPLHQSPIRPRQPISIHISTSIHRDRRIPSHHIPNPTLHDKRLDQRPPQQRCRREDEHRYNRAVFQRISFWEVG